MSFWIVVARAFHGSPLINPMLQLLLRMHTECFCTGSVVAAAEDRADRLMIIVSGRVRVYLAGRANRGSGLLLTLGPGYAPCRQDFLLADWTTGEFIPLDLIQWRCRIYPRDVLEPHPCHQVSRVISQHVIPIYPRDVVEFIHVTLSNQRDVFEFISLMLSDLST